MAPKKGDKKGKSDEPKKGGKDDKKGGKDEKKGGKKTEEPPAKSKGKDDGKKGKGKKPVSESEEEEEVKSEEEESGDSEEEVVTKKGGKNDKGKGKAALKGASKAVAMKSPKRSTPDDDDEEEEEDEEEKSQVKKGMSAVNLKKMGNVQIKGASKAMMGFAAEAQKNMGAAKAERKIDPSQLKGASKALTGLAGKASAFSLPSKQQPEKAKPKRNLKSTSRLFLRLSKKKKPNSKPLLGNSKLFAGFGGKSGGDKKPGLSGFSLFGKKDDAPKETKKTFNLSNLGGKGKMATEAKGLGGKFKGMFGKKKTGPTFKTKGLMVGRMAATTNWLTGRFLSSKGQGRLGGRAGRRGRKNQPYANRDTRERQTHYYNEDYGYDDEYGYEYDYDNRWGHRGYDPNDPYGDQMLYDDEEWEDEFGYYDDNGNFYYDDEFYFEDDVDNYGYPYGFYDDEYDDYYGNEGVEYYYGEDGMLYPMEPEPYGYYGDSIYGLYDPYEPEIYDDYFDFNMAPNYGLSDPYGLMNNSYDVASGLYNDPMLAYAQPAPVHNPYHQQVTMNAGLDPAEMGYLYGPEQFSSPLAEPFPLEQFRVPRPQVMLFGQDRLEVETLPPPPFPPNPSFPLYHSPSPALALNNQELLPDIQYEQPILAYPPAQTPYPIDMNQQHVSIPPGYSTLPTTAINHQEYLPPLQPAIPPLAGPPTSLFPSPLPPQLSSQLYQAPIPQDPQIFQLGQISPVAPPVQQMIHSPLHSPMVSPMPVRKIMAPSSPQLSPRPGSVRVHAPPSPHFSPHPMDIRQNLQTDPYFSPHVHNHGFTHHASMMGQRPTSSFDRQRIASPPSSPPPYRRGLSVRTQPSLARGRRKPGLRRGPSTMRPQSPFSSPLASPQQSIRRRPSPPPSPRLSFRQQPPPDAVPLPSTRPGLFKGRKQTSMMRRSPSPPLPSPQRQSPPQPERPHSPPQSFRPASPHRPPHRAPSPSPSRVSARPLPTRSSTRRLRGGPGARNSVPMGAVKPSPANPYSQRHGPRVTQQVAPFRSSIHSGPASPSGQIGSVAGTPMLARTGTRPTGLRESKRIGTGQGGFRRPVGRGQPLVRMPRSQPSLQSRQSFRTSAAVPPILPQPSLKHSGPISPQPSVRRLQTRPPSPQPLHRTSPLPSRSASPMYHASHPSSPLPQRSASPHSVGPTSFQSPVPLSNFSQGFLPPSQTISQYNYTMMEPGPSPMLTNALPGPQVLGSPLAASHFPISHPNSAYTSPIQRPTSPLIQQEVYPQTLPQQVPLSPNLGRTLQNPYLQNVDTIPLQRNSSPIAGMQGEELANVQETQMMSPYGGQGLSNALMQNSRLRSASYSSPLQRNANLYTNVLTPSETAAIPASSPLSSPNFSSAMLNSQLRNASFASPLQRHLSPTSSVLPIPPSTTPQQGGVRGSTPLFSSGLRTSQIQGSMFRLPSGTLAMSKGPGELPSTTNGAGGVDNGRLSPSALSSALQNPSLRQATYRLPDGSLITRNEPAQPQSPSVLSSALLNPNVRKATYRLPDGTLITRNEPVPESSSPMLSSAILNANVRKASYRLPDGSILTRPGQNTEPAENSGSSLGLSSALMNANLRKAKFQLPEGSSLFSRNQPQSPSNPLLSGALLNTNIRGASYNLPNTSLLRQRGSADTSEARSLDLSNALRNKNIRSSTYRLPDGTLMTRSQTASSPQSLDLSNALSKNPNLRGAKYRLPEGNIMTRLGAPTTPQQRTLNLSGALQSAHLQRGSFRLSSYAVVPPQVQGSGPEQHWAQGSEGLGLQQDLDVWGAERVLPHGTVQNLNKWSMYGDGELPDPQGLMRLRQVGEEPQEWNLNREGEPKGEWFDKMYSIRSMATIAEREFREEDGVEDMTQLDEMHEGAVLLNMRRRFDRELIYTYIGSILVSVNPYKMYNIYGTDMVLLYKGCALGENAPHLFAIANAAYSKMMDAKQNQVIIIRPNKPKRELMKRGSAEE